jgi:hypothetical protein
MSTALRSVGLLDILSTMPAGPSVALAERPPDAPCIHNRLRRLVTKPGEKCGLIDFLMPDELHVARLVVPVEIGRQM